MANRRQYHQMRRNILLDDRQRTVVIGTVLGDGSLLPTVSKNNLRLQIDHGYKQREYVFWKYAQLKSLVLTPPKHRQQTNSWRFRTISHPCLTDIGNLFYQGRRKKIPDNIASVLTEPMSLAVWFMDDGAKNRNDGLVLNTQCFTQAETQSLRDCLRENRGIDRISLQKDKNGWRLYIMKGSSGKMSEIIRPHVLPSMAYKLISPVETTRQLPD